MDLNQLITVILGAGAGGTVLKLYQTFRSSRQGDARTAADIRAQDADTDVRVAKAVTDHYAVLVAEMRADDLAKEKSFQRQMAAMEENYTRQISYLHDRILVLEQDRAREQSERLAALTANSDLVRENRNLKVEVERLERHVAKQDETLLTQAALIEELRDRIRALEGKGTA